ncbi:type VI secretion system protein VasJ, partial [Pseudomonas sp. ok272]
EGEFIDVPAQGFFPKGEPDELYRWPEREARFTYREGPHITALSGELTGHAGKWAMNGRRGLEYVDLQQGQRLSYKNEQPVKWTLIARADGGSCIEPHKES